MLMLLVEVSRQIFTRKVGVRNQRLTVWNTNHTSLVEQEIDFLQSDSESYRFLLELSYRVHRDVLTTHLWWTIVINSIVNLPLGKMMVITERSMCKRDWMVRPEQKSFTKTHYLMKNISKQRKVVVHQITRMCIPAEVCMALFKHHLFTRCKTHRDHFHALWLSVVKMSASHVLGEESDVSRPKRMRSAVTVFLKKMDVIAARSQQMVYDFSLGLFPTLLYLIHVMHFLYKPVCGAIAIRGWQAVSAVHFICKVLVSLQHKRQRDAA